MSPKTLPVYEKSARGWEGDIPNYCYSYEKMLETNWNPRFSSKQAIQKTLDDILEFKQK